MFINNQGNYLNKSDTDVEFDILFIASPIRLEIGKTSIFLTVLVFWPLLIVSVITKFLITELFIFLTASPKIRAKRRYIELQNLGQEVNMPALIADIEARDLKDSSRELSPLLPADDATIIDSSEMSLDEVFSFTENLIKKEFI